MTGQVHEDVDVVLTDDRGGLRIGEPRERTPDVRMGLNSRGRGIGLRYVGVADELDLPAVVAGEDRLEEAGDGMLAEVGRDVADAQAAPGERPDRPRLDRPGQWFGVLASVASSLGEDPSSIGTALVLHGQEQVAVDLCRTRCHHQSFAVEGDGLGDAPLIPAGIREIGERPEMIRVDAHGVFEGGLGMIGVPQGSPRQAEVIMGVDQIRPEFESPCSKLSRASAVRPWFSRARPRLLCTSARSGLEV